MFVMMRLLYHGSVDLFDVMRLSYQQFCIQPKQLIDESMIYV